jgi:hypothetical protein
VCICVIGKGAEEEDIVVQCLANFTAVDGVCVCVSMCPSAAKDIYTHLCLCLSLFHTRASVPLTPPLLLSLTCALPGTFKTFCVSICLLCIQGSGVQFGVGQRCLLVKEGKKGWTLLLTGVSHVSPCCPAEQLSLLFVDCSAHTHKHTQTHIRELSLTHTHFRALSPTHSHTHIKVHIHTLTSR